MDLTVQCKILPNKGQSELLHSISEEYIVTVNTLVSSMVSAGSPLKLSSRGVSAELPSAVKNQAIRDAKSVYTKYRKKERANAKKPAFEQKTINVPVLKKPVCIWNNQNWTLENGVLRFPVFVCGQVKRISVPVLLTDYQLERLAGDRGTLRITKKSGKWIAQIAVEVKEKETSSGAGAMGVDLGLKCPAVAVTDTGKTLFFGSGRQNKYIRRKFRATRRKLGKFKKISAIKKTNDKEQRWMKDQDHKISRGIVNFALRNEVSVIRMEKLNDIRKTARTSRKNEKNLHTWSFYRLARFIEYKAKLEGIAIEYINPKHTSQTCPDCKTLNQARDRRYQCLCGFKTHRDRLGAINIISAPVADGNSLSA